MLALEKLLGDHSSTPFNPEIANAFFRAGEHRAAGRGSLPQAARRARTAKRARQIEAWGRGVWRIFQACKAADTPKPILQYEPNDLWLEFPFSKGYLKSISHGKSTEAEVTPQVTPQVKRLLAAIVESPRSREELQVAVGIRDREHFRKAYLEPLLTDVLIERTIPEKPNSRLQKYRLTEKGRRIIMKDE